MSIVIGFGVPIHESVEGYTFGALAETWAAWLDIVPADWRLKIAPPRGCSVVENRNLAAAALLRDGFTAPDGHEVASIDAPRSPLTTRAADVIVWNDSDCCVEPEEYVRLVQALLDAPLGVGAVGYACPMQSGRDRPRPNCGRDPIKGRPAAPIQFAAPGPVALVQVDWIGFGVVATRAKVYHEMSECATPRRGPTEGPWFSHTSGPSGRGEDIGWCRDARALGFTIWVDVGVLGSHSYRAPHRLDDYYAKHHREG